MLRLLLILEVEVVKQHLCHQMQRKFIENQYLPILQETNGLDKIVKASFIATKGTMGKFIGMVEKIQKED